MFSRHFTGRRRRRGNILVLSALMMIGLMALLAMAVDIGYLCVARNELQRTADAAALAAGWELVDESVFTDEFNASALESQAEASATQFAALNPILQQAPGLGEGDVEVGYIADPMDPSSPLILNSSNPPNAVRVRVRRTSNQNGEIPFFIARAFGMDSMAADAEATAALLNNISGFRAPADGSNLQILPFALDEPTWTNLVEFNIGDDDWKWNEELQEVQPGADGILEVNLYPKGNGSPGNRGTVDIGSNNNSTADIARQILTGISEEDLAYHGGELKFNDDGVLELNGDTGISAGVKDELKSIIGQKRCIPIFSSVTGPGNNAQYTIIKFVGVRIMDVKLTGSPTQKRVIIQPASIVCKGAIPATEASSSDYVFSPVWLVR